MRLSRSLPLGLPALGMLATSLPAQVRVNPASANVSTQGASTVFLSYGGLRPDQVSVEAVWCGRVIPATPDVGLKCDPATFWGQLPSRYNRARASGVNGFTDIMSIPPSIARRAYQSAKGGSESSFFYVQRFRSTSGLPDEYVAVVLRLAGGGAGVPLSLTDVLLSFTAETPVLFVPPGGLPPALSARIGYTGTGRLIGRWEVVRPGEDLPNENDLLTEATLPEEQRGSQRRYTQLERFNVFLPPAGRVTLPGPEPARLPTDVEGSYLILLRIETSDDGAGDSDLDAVGSGTGIVHAGAVAGFPLPTLRYVVGGGASGLAGSERMTAPVQIEPRPDSVMDPAARMEFTWIESSGADYYRLEIARPDGQVVHSALIPRGLGSYRGPPWIGERAGGPVIRWRLVGLDANGREHGVSPWRQLRFRAP